MESEKVINSCSDSLAQAFFCPPVDTDSQRNSIIDRIKTFLKIDDKEKSTINIGQSNWESVGIVYSLTYHIVSVLRKLSLLPSERSILLPLQDQYQTIQLCLSRINKQKHGEFMAAASDVLDVWNHIYAATMSSSDCQQNSSPEANDLLEDLPIEKEDGLSSDPMKQQLNEAVNHYQEFLSTSGCLDHFQLYTIFKKEFSDNTSFQKEIVSKIFVIENINQMHKMEREMLKLILQNSNIYTVSVAVQESSENQDLEISGIGDDLIPLSQSFKDDESDSTKEDSVKKEDDAQDNGLETSCSEKIDVEIELVSDSISNYLECVNFEPSSQSASTQSISEEYIYQLVLSHVRLLINTRDELAITVCLSMPGNEISHQGFSDIKKMSKGKNMPMYQSILSYIRRLRLGGSGYQPDSNCPVLELQQPLGFFVDALDKLQDIVGDEPNPRKGANRVLGAIKTNLVQVRGCVLKKPTVEKVWMTLKGALEIFMEKSLDVAKDSGAKIQQTTAALRPCLKMLVHLLDWSSGLMTGGGIVDALGDNFLTQSQARTSNTPMRIPTVLAMFRSPVGKGSEDKHNASLRERLLKKAGTPVTKKSATTVNNFTSGCAWASDSSPVVEGLDTTLTPIVGPTLKAVGGKARSRSNSGNTNWRRIVEDVSIQEEKSMLEAAEEIVKSSKEKGKSKRSLLTDISNTNAEPKTKKSKETTVKSKKNAKEPAKEKPKEKVTKKTSKKCLPVPQGQKSIMNFFKSKDA